MSDENAVPEVPAEAPTTAGQEGNAPGEIVAASAEAAPVDTSATTSASNAALEEIPGADDLASRIAALEPIAQAVLKDALTFVADGFNNYSLMVGVLRLTGLLK